LLRVNTRVRKPPPRGALKLDRKFWENVAHVVVGDNLERIDRQMTPEGGRIKINAPSTLERKRRQGKPEISLVDTATRYIRGGFLSYRPTFLPGGTGVRVSPVHMRVARYLLDRGYRWFGLGNRGRAAIRALFREEVRRVLRRHFGGRR
jgi:hypothetical protein